MVVATFAMMMPACNIVDLSSLVRLWPQDLLGVFASSSIEAVHGRFIIAPAIG